MKKVITIISLALLLLLSGCTSQSDEDQIKETTTSYSDAVASQNWDEVCSLISKESIEAILAESGEATCPEAYRALPKAGQETLQRSASGTEFVSASVQGEKGTATLQTDAGQARVPVIQEDGSWRVHLFR